ncbi:hypothetical protein J2S49_000957 [Arcanobacterium wilhelmae]|uniref:Uncharacterized protein n=1 Tax=Arcanobacterium wilhelmae TaxID=1803177 RepID=A0ABT9NBV0_9ACTO|nr:hypothetical protein [Arcanobacterium wilhelmae]MDP9800881.1 hypothetical protein [Arcanobacterium wilhelmae]WFN90248.1 hypothetical protein P8A24_08705 [Arcanobacterium wilhelmae]
MLAALVFGAMSIYVKTIQSQVGDFITIYEAKDEIPPFTSLDETLLAKKRVRKRWASESAQVSLNALQGRRIGFTVEAGTTISATCSFPTLTLTRTNAKSRSTSIQ